MKKKLRKSKKNKGFIEIYGLHAVYAALNNFKRTHQKLIISSNLYEKCKDLREKVKDTVFLPNDKFCKIYGNEKIHQGIMLKTSNFEQISIDKLIKESQNKKKEVIIMLDQVTDPQNIGSIMRSCSLFNCQSIIVSKKNSPNVTSSMAKAASGALEFINFIKVTNLSRTINKFKKNNFWVVGFDSNKKITNEEIQLPKKCLLIFGSEDKGLRQLTINECDQILKIPMKSNSQFSIESLNVANACTIALYEHYKMNN